MAETGAPFTIPAVFVIRVRGGKNVESRDHLDHLRSAAARGTLPDVLDAIRDRHADDPVTDPTGHEGAEPR